MAANGPLDRERDTQWEQQELYTKVHKLNLSIWKPLLSTAIVRQPD